MSIGVDSNDYRKKPLDWVKTEVTTPPPPQKPEEKGATGPSVFAGYFNAQFNAPGNNCGGV